MASLSLKWVFKWTTLFKWCGTLDGCGDSRMGVCFYGLPGSDLLPMGKVAWQI